MKKTTILALSLLFSAAPAVSNAQADATPVPGTNVSTSTVTAASVVARVRAASAADRKRLVEEAIQNNPDMAGDLVALLIEFFPTEAATYTETVVQAVLALPVTTTSDQKRVILTDVAQKAVPAALLIPTTRVGDLVAAVNSVKNALANVPDAFQQAVQDYTAPVTASSSDVIAVFPEQDLPIVSGDTIS